MPHHRKPPNICISLIILVSICFFSIILSFLARKILKETTYFRQQQTLKEVKEENELLKTEILKLKNLALDKDGILTENQELRQMLALKKKYSPTFVAARIINRGPWQWQREFLIDRGSDSAIKPQDLIVDFNLNLVGKVEKVRKDSSWVRLASDPNFKAVVECNKIKAVLEGALFKGAKLLYVPYDLPLAKNDQVYISYFQRNLPSIKVGRISFAGKSYNSLTQNILVELSADFDSLTEVFVIRKD